ncbi:hypothetical protein [Nonomuraea lactucae]|uniref:hypothetical protein n=1 Tax=Nonomuraea lactucae TaxID=2249762 RepID=UPI000DE22DA2|nr:hypothetical protein [Nonomuraea lactucae]
MTRASAAAWSVGGVRPRWASSADRVISARISASFVNVPISPDADMLHRAMAMMMPSSSASTDTFIVESLVAAEIYLNG